MVNRVLAQKVLKMNKRGRKRRFSLDRMTEKVKTHSHVERQSTLNLGAVNQVAPVDPFWDVVFPPRIYTIEEMVKRCTKVPGWRAGNVVPRADVIKRYMELTAEAVEDHRVLLTPPEMKPIKQIWMHFNSAKDICFLIEINYKQEYMRRSYAYNSPFRVKEVFQRPSQILWQRSFPLIDAMESTG